MKLASCSAPCPTPQPGLYFPDTPSSGPHYKFCFFAGGALAVPHYKATLRTNLIHRKPKESSDSFTELFNHKSEFHTRKSLKKQSYCPAPSQETEGVFEGLTTGTATKRRLAGTQERLKEPRVSRRPQGLAIFIPPDLLGKTGARSEPALRRRQNAQVWAEPGGAPGGRWGHSPGPEPLEERVGDRQ